MGGDATSFITSIEKREEYTGLQISHQTSFHSPQQTNHTHSLWYYRLQILLHPQQKRMTVAFSVLYCTPLYLFFFVILRQY